MRRRRLLLILASWRLALSMVHAQDWQVTKCEYWIDSKEKQEVAVDGSEVAITVDASQVSEGLHTLNYRVKDNTGMFSPLQTWMFIRTAFQNATTENKVTSVEYWFDGKTEKVHTQAIQENSASFSVEASALNHGAHTFSYRVKDARGQYSKTQTWAFIRDVTTPTKIVWYKYWWNNHEDKAVKENIKNNGEEYVFTKEMVLPEYAMTDGFSRRSAARLSIVFGDDMGNVSSLVCSDVTFPDVIPPVTVITTDKEESTGSVTLTWSANEDEIEFYNIYYSENDQPFVLWMPNTTKETATFKGQPGSTYRFTVTARDKTGNRELLDESKNVTVKFSAN